jgi:hypothetical protein
MYGNLIDAQVYWDARGYSGTPTKAGLVIGSAYVDQLGWRIASTGVPVSRFPGTPTTTTQENEWPRTDATDVYGREFASDEVPACVEWATYEAAYYEQTNPGSLNVVVRTDQVISREKIDVIEFEYRDQGTASRMLGLSPSTPVIPAANAALAPVLTGGANPYGITGVVA